jgi:hypothetical protein
MRIRQIASDFRQKVKQARENSRLAGKKLKPSRHDTKLAQIPVGDVMARESANYAELMRLRSEYRHHYIYGKPEDAERVLQEYNTLKRYIDAGIL